MSSISAFSHSRGHSTDVLRTTSSNRKEDKHAEKAPPVKKVQKGKKGEQVRVNEESAALKKHGSDAKIGKRLDKLDSKYSEVSKKLTSALANRGNKAEIEALGAKFDSFADETTKRFDDVDNKLNDLTNRLSDQLDDVADDLTTAFTELQDVVTRGTNSNSNTIKILKDDFNKQFADLQAQHESETNGLLDKLNEVTEQLKTLSEQSSEQISVLKDQLGGLGGLLGTLIDKLDLLGGGQNLSLRSIGLFGVAAKTGNGALDKLIGIIGSNRTGNQLRSVQSRLQSFSSRFGAGQSAAGLNLLA